MTLAREFEAMRKAGEAFVGITEQISKFFLRSGKDQYSWTYPVQINLDGPLIEKLNALTLQEQDYIDNILEAVGEEKGKILQLIYVANNHWQIEITPILPFGGLDDGDDDTSPQASYSDKPLVMAAAGR
jgi:hypothetical protein